MLNKQWAVSWHFDKFRIKMHLLELKCKNVSKGFWNQDVLKLVNQGYWKWRKLCIQSQSGWQADPRLLLSSVSCEHEILRKKWQTFLSLVILTQILWFPSIFFLIFSSLNWYVWCQEWGRSNWKDDMDFSGVHIHRALNLTTTRLLSFLPCVNRGKTQRGWVLCGWTSVWLP